MLTARRPSPRLRQLAATTLFGTANPPGSPWWRVGDLGEHRADHLAGRVDQRAARVARLDQAAQRADLAHRRVAVGVVGGSLLRLAEPPGPALKAPSSGYPRIAADSPDDWPAGQLSGLERSARDAQHRDVVVRVEDEHAAPAAPAGRRRTCTVVSVSPATTCALVTTSPGPATQPLPSIPRPQACPTIRTTAGLAAITPWARRIAMSGAGTVGGATVDARQRVDPPERVEDRP